MKSSLADSLNYITKAIEPELFGYQETLRRLTQNLGAGMNYQPSVFADYTELIISLINEDLRRSRILLDRLACAQPCKEDLRLIALDQLDEPNEIHRYRQLLELDKGEDRIISPTDKQRQDFLLQFSRALSFIQVNLPEFYLEFEALTHQLVMVVPETASRYIFDGGSCFMLWGTIFLNIQRSRSLLELVQVLAHESAHLLLYGLACEEPLVTNTDSERYPSPLRTDLRPMNGIFHATWVSARMYWSMVESLRCTTLTVEEQRFAQEAAKRNHQSFMSGYDVIQSHAKLTPTGKALIDSAYAFMRADSFSTATR